MPGSPPRRSRRLSGLPPKPATEIRRKPASQSKSRKKPTVNKKPITQTRYKTSSPKKSPVKQVTKSARKRTNSPKKSPVRKSPVKRASNTPKKVVKSVKKSVTRSLKKGTTTTTRKETDENNKENENTTNTTVGTPTKKPRSVRKVKTPFAKKNGSKSPKKRGRPPASPKQQVPTTSPKKSSKKKAVVTSPKQKVKRSTPVKKPTTTASKKRVTPVKRTKATPKKSTAKVSKTTSDRPRTRVGDDDLSDDWDVLVPDVAINEDGTVTETPAVETKRTPLNLDTDLDSSDGSEVVRVVESVAMKKSDWGILLLGFCLLILYLISFARENDMFEANSWLSKFTKDKEFDPLVNGILSFTLFFAFSLVCKQWCQENHLMKALSFNKKNNNTEYLDEIIVEGIYCFFTTLHVVSCFVVPNAKIARNCDHGIAALSIGFYFSQILANLNLSINWRVLKNLSVLMYLGLFLKDATHKSPVLLIFFLILKDVLFLGVHFYRICLASENEGRSGRNAVTPSTSFNNKQFLEMTDLVVTLAVGVATYSLTDDVKLFWYPAQWLNTFSSTGTNPMATMRGHNSGGAGGATGGN